jgi:hypothetical protein
MPRANQPYTFSEGWSGLCSSRSREGPFATAQGSRGAAETGGQCDFEFFDGNVFGLSLNNVEAQRS